MDGILNGTLPDLVFPFLDIRSLLTLSCVSTYHHALIERHCFSQPGYFRKVCQSLCSFDRTTFAGLLTGSGYREEPTAVIAIRRREEPLIGWISRSRQWCNDNTEDDVIFDLIQIFSWKEICLKLLNRIETIDRRSLPVLTPEAKQPHALQRSHWYHRAKTAISDSIALLTHPNPGQSVKLKALIIGGNAYDVRDAFYGICNANGLSESDISRWATTFLTRSGHQAVLPQSGDIPVDWSLHSIHYGPAGVEPQDSYCFLPRLIQSKLCCPDVLVWTIPLRSLNDPRSTPYHYPSLAMANRICLRDFVLARGYPCRILVVLVTMDSSEELDTETCRQSVVHRLGLESLTPLGIVWHVTIGRLSRRRNLYGNNGPSLEGFSDALDWALSQMTIRPTAS